MLAYNSEGSRISGHTPLAEVSFFIFRAIETRVNTRCREGDMISQDLLDILACPACEDRPPVKISEDKRSLSCEQCGRHYPIKEDIPVMLVEEAFFPEKEQPVGT